MKSQIVRKLFLLTTLLCAVILGTIYIGQTFFFKQYYISQKVNALQESLLDYQLQYESGAADDPSGQGLARSFFREHNGWLALLDTKGNSVQADAIAMDVSGVTLTGEDVTYRVPLQHIVSLDNVESFTQFLEEQASFWIYGIPVDGTLIPALLTTGESNVSNEGSFQNPRLKRQMDAHFAERLKQEQAYNDKDALYAPFTYLQVQVDEVRLASLDSANSMIYESLFLDEINAFQVRLLMDNEEDSTGEGPETLDVERANIAYKIMIQPITAQDGQAAYIIAMASLQPVDEAVNMINQYFGYMIAFVSVLIVLVAFYYSVRIARPLLQVHAAAKQIAALNFTETAAVKTNDEIGELSRTLHLLSHKLQAYIAQLHSDIEQEKRLVDTRKAFIADVSHELKTPLAVMKSCISILRDGVAAHKKDHYFSALDKEVNKMDELIVGMLELAKYESGTYRLQMETFDVEGMIEGVVELFDTEVKNKQLQLGVAAEPIQAIAHIQRIEQVLTNFLANAIRHTPPGKGIHITAAVDGERVKLCVENEGDPIPTDQLHAVWNRFYQGDEAHSSTSGSGLGLAIAHTILQLHGAEYGVANTSTGVAFYFWLPIQTNTTRDC